MNWPASRLNLERRWAAALTGNDAVNLGMAKLGDLPMEQPGMFNLAVQMKTAHAPGLMMPPPVVVRIIGVIE